MYSKENTYYVNYTDFDKYRLHHDKYFKGAAIPQRSHAIYKLDM